MSRETVAWVTSKPCVGEGIDDLALAADRPRRDELADRPLALRLEVVAVLAVVGRCVRSCRARPARPGVAVIRVPNVGSSRARSSASGADESAMIASAPSQPSAPSAARTLGTIPPAMTPDSMSVSASPDGQRVEPAAVGVADAVDVGEQHELAGTEPGRDPGRDVVGVDVADDAVRVARERRDDRHLAADEDRVEQVAPQPDDAATSPSSGIRSAMSRPPSTPDRPTASTPRSRRPDTSSLLTTPRRTAAATSSDWASVTRRPPSNLLGTPSRSSHSVMRLPPPWTRTTGRRRATAATSASTCDLVGDRRPAELDDEDLAHVVYSEFSMT